MSSRLGKEKVASSDTRPKKRVPSKLHGDSNTTGKVYIVTGGARGLGLSMAEAQVEFGAIGRALQYKLEVLDDLH